jgi:hypothetical protein
VILRFYIDPETDAPHIHRHDVDESEVEDVLRRPIEDRPGREGARVAIGQSRAGRYLRVVYVPDPAPDDIRDHGLRTGLKTPTGAPQAPKKEAMKQSQFPEGWDELG